MHLSPELLAVATPAELEAYKKALVLQLALASPLDYAEHVSTRTERYRHIALLNGLVTRLVEGRLRHPVTGRVVRKLAVSMPPRHGKSYLISDHTPAWAITKYARYGMRVGVASYEATFAASWGRKARQHVSESAEEFGLAIDNATRAADSWELLPFEPGGPRAGMNTAGVGGPLTGKGFHVLIIDDPIKNAEEAKSATIRDNHYDWLGSTALTRLEPPIPVPNPDYDPDNPSEDEPATLSIGHCVILVNTRWHEDDLMGRVLRDQPDEWYHLNLKALADEAAPVGDPLGRQPGEALCPERFSAPELEAVRSDPSVGVRWFSAMYQGEPNIEGGGIFKAKNFRYWRPGPGDLAPSHYTLLNPDGVDEYLSREKLTRFQTIDLAATEKTTSDWSVISTWEVPADRRLLLVDRVRQRLEAADHEEWAWTHYTRMRPSFVGVEKATFGLNLIKHLQRRGVPVVPLPTDKDKTSRAIPAGALIDALRVYFPKDVGWLLEWEKELLSFPNGTHDDQVDTLAYAAYVVTLGSLSTPQQAVQVEENTPQARLERYMDRRFGNKRPPRRHPMLGRF